MKTLQKIVFLFLAAGLLGTVSCGTGGKKEIGSGEMTRIEVEIAGMTCTGCEQTIQGSVTKLEGVGSVKADHLAGRAVVEYSSANTDTSMIREAIVKSGYKVIRFSQAIPSDSAR